MNCLGCYTEVKEGYCLSCRKKLFGKSKIASVLPFAAPKEDKLSLFQEHSKRLSISGVQLKYSLRLVNNEWELCEKGSQYILKPIPPARQLEALEDAPENEHLTMQLATQLFKIKTAANAIIYFNDGQPAYITRRFDVREDGLKYLQEDFAQITNRSKENNGLTYKYEGSYEEIGQLIKKFVAASMPALENFFQLIVYNYIISNGDAHLKNFSLIRTDSGEYELTPAYDLMSTVIHTPHESDTALSLYENDLNSAYYSTYGCYGRSDFLELAKRLGIVETRAIRIIDDFLLKRNQMETFVSKSFLSGAAKDKYVHYVNDKLRRMG